MKGSLDIVGGNLIDGKADRPRHNCSLRVKDGRIVALWEGARAPTEASDRADRVIDATGKTVMPGLIDAHCHISYGEGRSAEEVFHSDNILEGQVVTRHARPVQTGLHQPGVDYQGLSAEVEDDAWLPVGKVFLPELQLPEKLVVVKM